MRTIKNRNTNGRPNKELSQKKGYRVEVRFATLEYQVLKVNAKTLGISISEYIRSSIENCEIKERLNATHHQYILSLIGMANNLNQIARSANTYGYFKAAEEAETLTQEIKRLLNRLRDGS